MSQTNEVSTLSTCLWRTWFRRSLKDNVVFYGYGVVKMSVMVRTGFVIASVLLVCCLTSFLSVLLLCLIIIVCSLCVYFYPGYNTLRASFEPLTQRLKSEVPIVFTKNFDKINDKLNYRMNTANLSKSFSSPTVKLRQSSSLSRSASFKEKENLSVLNNSRSYLTTSTFFKNKPESLKGSVLKRSSTFHAGSALLSSPLLPRVRRGATADEHIRLRDASRFVAKLYNIYMFNTMHEAPVYIWARSYSCMRLPCNHILYVKLVF